MKPAIEVAIDRLSSAANQGHANASLELARCYSAGVGVDKDMKQAASLLEVAVEAGVPAAYGALGGLYAKGVWVPGGANITKALEYLDIAVKAGDAKAMVNTGFLCAEGRAPGGMKEAFKLFKGAAKKGDTVGMSNVASMLKVLSLSHPFPCPLSAH